MSQKVLIGILMLLATDLDDLNALVNGMRKHNGGNVILGFLALIILRTITPMMKARAKMEHK